MSIIEGKMKVINTEITGGGGEYIKKEVTTSYPLVKPILKALKEPLNVIIPLSLNKA